jgi:Collagen triple helix repeat (20 copies)
VIRCDVAQAIFVASYPVLSARQYRGINTMKRRIQISILLLSVSLAACEQQPAVVTVPATPVVVPVPGPPGPPGDTGSQGVQGDQGYTGNQGEPGQIGDKGDQGNQGNQGDTGATGEPAPADKRY